MSGADRIVIPGEITSPFEDIPALVLPGRELFARRADRFRRLAPGNPLEGYLAFLARLASAQQTALERLTFPPGGCYCSGRTGSRPLDARTLARSSSWRQLLRELLERMGGSALPEAAAEAVAGLLRSSDASLEMKAESILDGDLGAISPGELPFVAAALQVYWGWLAAFLDADAVPRAEQSGTCPVCGADPVAGMVLGSGEGKGVRYLCCSLCATRWRLERIVCSSCLSPERIDYAALAGNNGAVKGECCQSCDSYLKLLYLDKDPNQDPTADDLATLALDMLLHADGMTRIGPNLLFHPGN